MALASCSGFFFMFSLVFLIKSADSRCEKRFNCGHLDDPLEFPFSNNNECGLFMVDCSASPPSFQLGPGGPRFLIHNQTSANKFVVEDPDLGSYKRCHSIQNRSLPSFPYISFEITSDNITILSCSKFLDPKDEERMRGYFVHGYKNNSECEHSYFYYGFPSHAISTPEYCSIVRMPVSRSDLEIPYGLFKLLSIFKLEWRVSANCTKCHDEGRKCLAGSNNEFLCEAISPAPPPAYSSSQGSRKNSKTIKLVAAITVSAAVFLGLCFILSFLIYRRKKRANGAHLLSRNISCDPSSKSDIEGSRLFFGIPIFSYTELEEATNNFNPSKELGDGGFGTVYYGKLRDGREVAIKRLYEHSCKRVEQFVNEIRILTRLRHPNLVSLYGCTSRRSRELLLVYEYIPNGTVADHLHGERANTAPLSWPVRMNIAIETASALAYLHNSDIIHRDVKTHNILLDSSFCVKVADFGLSRLFPNDVTHILTAPQGTPGYVDPDYHECYQLTDKSDVYSFGVVLVELISSMPAVDITRQRHEINLADLALNRIQRCAFDELIDFSLGCKSDGEVARMTNSVAELAFRCLQLEKDMRPSMDEVLDSLNDIKGGMDCEFEQTKKANGVHTAPAQISPTPGTDDVVLLNQRNFQSSPVSVTDRWASSGST